MPEDTTNPKAWVNLTLPSHGIFYKDGLGKELIPDGAIQIRKLTVDEMSKLQSQGMDMMQRISAILRAASKIPNGFSADKLLLTDRQAILLWQRVISLGPSYTFTYRCPGCKSTVKHTTNIVADLEETTPEEVRIKLKGEEPVEPFTVELPDERVKVTCRFLRGEDEIEIIKRSKKGKMQSLDQSDPSSVIRMALVITHVNGEEWDTRRKEQMIRAMTIGDSLRIEHAVEKRETGIDTTVYPTCNTCGYDLSDGVALPFGNEFFRPSADHFGDDSGAQVLLDIPRKRVYGAGDRDDGLGRNVVERQEAARPVVSGKQSEGTASGKAAGG